MAYFQGEMPWRVIGSFAEDATGAEITMAKQRADAVYTCEHQTIYYRLDSGKADEYYLPRPVCVNCGHEMRMTELFKREKEYSVG